MRVPEILAASVPEILAGPPRVVRPRVPRPLGAHASALGEERDARHDEAARGPGAAPCRAQAGGRGQTYRSVGARGASDRAGAARGVDRRRARAEAPRPGPALEGGAVPRVRHAGPGGRAGAAVARDPASRSARWIRRREERDVLADRVASAEAGPAGGAVRGAARRVLSARLRPRRRALPRRVEEAGPLLRVSAQVFTLGRGVHRSR